MRRRGDRNLPRSQGATKAPASCFVIPDGERSEPIRDPSRPVSETIFFASLNPGAGVLGSRRSRLRRSAGMTIKTHLGSNAEQPGTWATVLTGDMGNTFPVLFRSVAAVVGPVDPVGNASSRCPQVHRLGAWVCADDRRGAR